MPKMIHRQRMPRQDPILRNSQLRPETKIDANVRAVIALARSALRKAGEVIANATKASPGCAIQPGSVESRKLNATARSHVRGSSAKSSGQPRDSRGGRRRASGQMTANPACARRFNERIHSGSSGKQKSK